MCHPPGLYGNRLRERMGPALSTAATTNGGSTPLPIRCAAQYLRQAYGGCGMSGAEVVQDQWRSRGGMVEASCVVHMHQRLGKQQGPRAWCTCVSGWANNRALAHGARLEARTPRSMPLPAAAGQPGQAL